MNMAIIVHCINLSTSMTRKGTIWRGTWPLYNTVLIPAHPWPSEAPSRRKKRRDYHSSPPPLLHSINKLFSFVSLERTHEVVSTLNQRDWRWFMSQNITKKMKLTPHMTIQTGRRRAVAWCWMSAGFGQYLAGARLASTGDTCDHNVLMQTSEI